MSAVWMKSQHIVSKTVNVLGMCDIALASYLCSCCFVYCHMIKKVRFVKVSFYLLGILRTVVVQIMFLTSVLG